MFCRLRKRRQSRCLPREPGRQRHSGPQRLRQHGPLGRVEAGRFDAEGRSTQSRRGRFCEDQPRRHRRPRGNRSQAESAGPQSASPAPVISRRMTTACTSDSALRMRSTKSSFTGPAAASRPLRSSPSDRVITIEEPSDRSSGHSSGARRASQRCSALRPSRSSEPHSGTAVPRVHPPGPEEPPKRSPMPRRSNCSSPPMAHGSTCFARAVTKSAFSMHSTYAPIKNIPVGHIPRGFSLSPGGERLFVANTWDDTISVIDTSSLNVAATWPVGSEPSSVIEDRAGKRLYVANRISNDVAVLDAQTGAEEKRLAAGRGASYITPRARWRPPLRHPRLSQPAASAHARRQPDSSPIRDHRHRYRARNRRRPHQARPHRPLLPHRVLSRWPPRRHRQRSIPRTSSPSRTWSMAVPSPIPLTLFGADVGKPVELPLDELERYAARPFGVAISPDKSRIYVTCEGSEIVIVIDVRRGLALVIHARPGPVVARSLRERELCNGPHPVGHDPRGMIFSPTAANCWSPTVLKTPSASSTPRTNRLAVDRSSRRAEAGLASCVTANRRSTQRAILSRARSVAPTATSIPPLTASHGTSSRMDLAATLSTTA